MPLERSLTLVSHLCGCPVLHMPLLHQAFLSLWGAMMMLPRWALGAWSHSCCRCGANLLMSGPACSSYLPANKTGDVLHCSWNIMTEQPHQVGMLVLSSASDLSLHGLPRGGCLVEPPVQPWQRLCQVPYAWFWQHSWVLVAAEQTDSLKHTSVAYSDDIKEDSMETQLWPS